jgi:hypothetical protein
LNLESVSAELSLSRLLKVFSSSSTVIALPRGGGWTLIRVSGSALTLVAGSDRPIPIKRDMKWGSGSEIKINRNSKSTFFYFSNKSIKKCRMFKKRYDKQMMTRI